MSYLYDFKPVSDEEAKQLHEKQKAESTAYWAEKNKPRIVTCRVPHTCMNCLFNIEKGEKAIVKTRLHNVSVHGYTPQMLTHYYHAQGCKP